MNIKKFKFFLAAVLFALLFIAACTKESIITDAEKQISPASVTTNEAIEITTTEAICGGTVNNDGGATVTVRGICWDTCSLPAITGNHSHDAAGKGSFTSILSGLLPGKEYFARAYATNSAGTSYGNEISFTTRLIITPEIITDSVYSITPSTASGGGKISNDGGLPVISRGLCWGIHHNPSISGNHSVNGSGTGTFTGNITGLNPGTLYYVKAYATNSLGTAYGNEVSFTSGNLGLPSVTTSVVYSITYTSAMGGGTVWTDGGCAVTTCGICWGTNPGPDITGWNTSVAGGLGTFYCGMYGLSPGVQYYVRAYATNPEGTAYGNEITFTTNPLLVPALSTITVNSITTSSAESGGQISSFGGSPITAKGVCWSINPNPAVSDNHTSNGSGTGSYISNITGLNPGTQYHVRAYATNAVGTAYGNDLVFTTLLPTVPAVSTASLSLLTGNSVSCGGNITNDGGGPITGRGVCWSTNSNPQISDGHTSDGTGTGLFTSHITGLAGFTCYYVRAYATNSAGTSYGSTLCFTTNPAGLLLGGSYLGGTIAYFLQPGDPGYIPGEIHGLIAAPSDQSTGIAWCNESSCAVNGTSTEFGTGSINTDLIVAEIGLGSYAASICADLVINSYNDWYLPSKDELNKLYLNHEQIGNFYQQINVRYWSSSLTYGNYWNAWCQNFQDGTQYSNATYGLYRVRAVRSF